MYGDAWDAIAKAHKAYPTYIRDRRIFEQAGGFNSTLFNFARTLVRLAAESEKPNAERLPEYTDARRASLELGLYSPAPIHEDFEKLKLADSLGFMVELLGADNELVKQVLAGKTPEARANELIAGTKLKDPEYRKEVAKGGKAAIESSTDPMIVVAKMIDAKAREARKRYESEVTGVERTNYAKIARALFETEGTKLYPDATFTLRLSYGAVEGYTENGKKVAPFTTLGGLYGRSEAFKKAVSVCSAAAVVGQEERRESEYAVQLRVDERHHRRQLGIADDQPERGTRWIDLRRQHSIARRRLHVRRLGESRDLSRFARHARSDEEDLRCE